ncbi:MAG TPA: bifunctional 2-polyprenyl-6-hydroxyphenol methylase/3-demethylubiquinol 3-O-methyltransferase UbiG [Steroidobacteraceae bacterium]|nr:bifunctional 2-polyprenyl-6-hydroxyphenol methylase/3-demethylubiquinol 3-O-methyltransferase UbiG [Steroidobacteraceae bacterium]
MAVPNNNVDPAELAKFDDMAQNWWDPRGSSKPLHDLNPLRLEYLRGIAGLDDKEVVDVGCGGGILSEAMARGGGRVLGIDLAPAVLEVAGLHAQQTQTAVSYRAISAEALAAERPQSFDLVTCMETLEHVPDPCATLRALAALLRPEGDLVVSTLHRNWRSFLVAIVGAEHVARVLPPGTHEYLKFIRPSELAKWGRAAGLELRDLTGIAYNPLTRSFRLSAQTTVNYLAHFRRDAI